MHDGQWKYHRVNFLPLSVISFGRCKFQLSVGLVGCLIQSSIGVIAEAFWVIQLYERVFRVSIFLSNHVGFSIYNLRSYECDAFKAYFRLWIFGGPNWIHEIRDYKLEEYLSWHTISQKSRSPLTYEEVVHTSIMTRANSISLRNRRNHFSGKTLPSFNRLNSHQSWLSIFHRLSFPKNQVANSD